MLDGSEKRKSPRYCTIAQARIPGVLEGDSLLENISITGCCVECTAYSEIKPKMQYELEIIPENAAGIGKFVLHVECLWARSGDYSSQIGFSILSSPKGRLFQRYVDYLAYRSNQT
ncbi:MAG: PilZ domain-containing protein [Treponema sp.]|jgi:hypothetical protein|nr:PilZ domain-containing protein [Treponema sp.]